MDGGRGEAALGCVLGGEAGDFFAVFVDVVSGDVGVELADVREDDVAHDGVAELFGEHLEAGDDALACERVDAAHGSRFGDLHLERALSEAEP